MTPAQKRRAGKRQAPKDAYWAAVRGYHRCELRLALGTAQPPSPQVLADYAELTRTPAERHAPGGASQSVPPCGLFPSTLPT
jgi:hypothetical protein